MNNNNIPELLSPVGDQEKLMAAINGGCDAVYLGGKDFSARSQAGNFNLLELKEALDIAHLRGIKVYLTINTLYKDEELEELFQFIAASYELGVDAFIVQDIGTGVFIKENFPNAKLHASTQMTIHNLEDGKYLEQLGFDRIVLSRELSIEEIKNITKNINIETEVFIHGALCISFSGQCTISSLIGGRSGNRGRCGQTCRLNFDLMKENQVIESGYLLSPKDIMTLPILHEIINTGVTSLKIEGRMKNKEYVATTTSIYRKQLDKIQKENHSVDREDVNNLAQVFIRGDSFSSGYFKTYSSKIMMSNKTPKKTGLYLGKVDGYKNGKVTFKTNEPLTAGDRIGIFTQTLPHVGSSINTNISKGGTVRLDIKGNINIKDPVYKSYSKNIVDSVKAILNDDNKKVIISGNVKAKIGKPLEFSITHNDINIKLQGVVVEKSENRPVTEEQLLEQLSKSGNTTFILNFNEIDVDENIFISIKDINNLRRDVLDEFTNEFINSFRREKPKYDYKLKTFDNKDLDNKKILVLVTSKKSFDVVSKENVYGIYIDNNILREDVDYYIENSNGKKIYSALPIITRMYDVKDLKEDIEEFEKKDIAGYLISNYSQLEILKDSNKEKVLNSNFNILNNLTYDFLINQSDRVTSSVELNLKEINISNGKNKELISYGRFNVMTIANCPIGIYIGDKDSKRFCNQKFKENDYYLKDPKDFEFPIKTNCYQCYGQLYNSSVLYMSDKMYDLRESNAEYIRLEFLDEDEDAIRNIIKAYEFITTNKQHEYKIDEKNVTYGHFYRGIL